MSSYRYFLGSRAQEYLGVTNRLVPYHKGNLGNDDLVTTAMWDITKSGHEINWSGAFGAGLEHELLSLNYLHIFTHNAEDLAVLSEDTQGQEFYDSPPFRRTETLIFKERDTQSDQLSGKITFPVAPLGSDAWFRLVNPVLDWKFSQNESSLVQPDKRILSHTWSEGLLLAKRIHPMIGKLDLMKMILLNGLIQVQPGCNLLPIRWGKCYSPLR